MKLRKQARIIGCEETYYKIENNCRISISLLKQNLDKPWYFVVSHNLLIFSYNSNLDQIMFTSKKECLLAAENKIREFVKTNFSTEHDNVHTAICK